MWNPLLTIRGGEVLRTGYDPVLYGNYLLIYGEGEDCSLLLSSSAAPGTVAELVWRDTRLQPLISPAGTGGGETRLITGDRALILASVAKLTTTYSDLTVSAIPP